MGLSMSHKWTFKAVVQGQLVHVKPVGSSAEKQTRGVRGDVLGMSKASRKRLIEKVLTMDDESMSKRVFVTLTYHKKVEDPLQIKKHLASFWRKVKKKFGDGLSCLWRMEMQARNVKHFHLIIFGIDFIPFEWVARAWWGSAGMQSDEHLRAGTRIEKIRSKRGVVYYVAKYIAKPDDAKTVGRVWGIMGRRNFKVCERKEILLTLEHRKALEEYYRGRVGALAFPWQGFTLYGETFARGLVSSGVDSGNL